VEAGEGAGGQIEQQERVLDPEAAVSFFQRGFATESPACAVTVPAALKNTRSTSCAALVSDTSYSKASTSPRWA